MLIAIEIAALFTFALKGSSMLMTTDDVEALNIRLFDPIPSQTSDEDKRSLLAVHRAVRSKHPRYSYLEIGSHLGGSLQNHVLDDQCEVIYSIDPRPAQQPDDRAIGYIAAYENNSTERMLELLRGIGGDTSKVCCFELDAGEVDPTQIDRAPDLAFIDGEHTEKAVLSDFEFCRQVLRSDGTILFHDFSFIFPAIERICRSLAAEGVAHVPLKLEGSVFGIFFDPALVGEDPYLSALLASNRNYLRLFLLKRKIEKAVPLALLQPLRSGYRRIRGG